MFDVILRWYRSRSEHPYVRPWGLAVPILVLVVCLPMLRPLRHPVEISDDELTRLATIHAIVEHRTLTIDPRSTSAPIWWVNASGTAKRQPVRQAPAMAAMLAGPYWVMHRLGLTFNSNFALTAYMLTLLGVTLPVAGAAGLVYRMARIFELPRLWRMVLAATAVFGSGLLSYATFLNPHAPAAVLVLGAVGALVHGAVTRSHGVAYAWMAAGGLAAAFAAVLDPAAIAFLALLGGFILFLRWPVHSRVFAVAWYLLGTLAPIALHIVLMGPASLHPPGIEAVRSVVQPAGPATRQVIEGDDGTDVPGVLGHMLARLADGLVGAHGLFSHFPVVLVGLAGILALVHGNWPLAVKTLGVICLAATGIIVLVCTLPRVDWSGPMFSVRWFVVFLPVMVFWAGPWLRRPHATAIWILVAVLLALSVTINLIGAAGPFVQPSGQKWTVIPAAKQMVNGSIFAP